MENEPKQHEVLRRASLFLEKNNREAKVAELLLQHYLDVSRSTFFMMMRDPVPETVLTPFHQAIKQHAETGVPVEHLTGHAYFYGREFHVNAHTLIPRPETEELIQHIYQTVPKEPQTIVDIGTGSGIIAVTLALLFPSATVYATDISQEALDVARQNAEQLGAKVIFLQGDYLEPLIEQRIQADMVVSNPPYIAPDEKLWLADTVKNFDPERALFAGDHGLGAYKQIISRLPNVIKQEGSVVFEIGHQQGEAVKSLLQNVFPKSDVAIIPDINGKDRIVSGVLKQAPTPEK
ncbi:peptide chain release factor N(5)-glutamine methyltransferase [Lentibacillus salicampi]|uniref:Release factor glutamine methyltransferase n=1 Tax=Lentibacillus salicampi TaxID=175306 RepID=A0A4Y9AG67_9BACI|nr:peptide chain release factor N(5)-glutamine methyltransferase [Lentibacillus salicampi]TFJ93374.1 peptide chain release factor N(5)-glutamine methyltransferase [Lentibacillus salicampi]